MWSVGISVSPCADAERIGYDARQINRIVIRMAQYFLDRNMRVVFGHDWRKDGVMRAVADFAEVVAARRAETSEEKSGDRQLAEMGNRVEPRMINVVPTGRAPLSRTAFEAQRESGGVLKVMLVSEIDEDDYEQVRERHALDTDQQARAERAAELTALRYYITELLDPGCRICLGGKMKGYAGREPGVIEEALLALEFHKPLYLMGGFGGAARWFGTQAHSSGWDYWRSANGLKGKHKRELFETTDIEHALRLIRAGIQALPEWHRV